MSVRKTLLESFGGHIFKHSPPKPSRPLFLPLDYIHSTPMPSKRNRQNLAYQPSQRAPFRYPSLAQFGQLFLPWVPDHQQHSNSHHPISNLYHEALSSPLAIHITLTLIPY